MEICFKPIGIVHSEHVEQVKTPIQPIYAKECKGYVEVVKEFQAGLKDLEGFSHIYLIYHLHKIKETKLIVKPFLQDIDRGIFATRAPFRPNRLGLSIVELIKVENNILHISGVDILDGTPLIDIKPYTQKFDNIPTLKNGWQDEVSEDIAQIRGKREYKK